MLLAGTAAVAANIGILNAADSSAIGDLAATDELLPAAGADTDTTTTVTVETAPSTTRPRDHRTPASAAQQYDIAGTGTVWVMTTTSGLALDHVVAEPGWIPALTQSDLRSLRVDFVNGDRTIVFTASLGDDGTRRSSTSPNRPRSLKRRHANARRTPPSAATDAAPTTATTTRTTTATRTTTTTTTTTRTTTTTTSTKEPTTMTDFDPAPRSTRRCLHPQRARRFHRRSTPHPRDARHRRRHAARGSRIASAGLGRHDHVGSRRLDGRRQRRRQMAPLRRPGATAPLPTSARHLANRPRRQRLPRRRRHRPPRRRRRRSPPISLR